MHRFAGGNAESWVRVVRTLALTRPKTLGRLGIIGLLMPYLFWLAFSYEYHFIDGVNLLIHEAGHMLFLPFGETWHFLGGTLLQIAIPIAFCVHFVRRGDRFSGAIMGVWLAESLMNVGRYMGDAVAQQLPLIGGGMHDWQWLLRRAGLLRHTEALSFTTHIIAVAIAGASVWFAWVYRDYTQSIVGLRGSDDPEVNAQREEAAQQEAKESPGRPLGDAFGMAWQASEDGDDSTSQDPSDQRRRVLV